MDLPPDHIPKRNEISLKVLSENIEPFSRNVYNSPDFRGISDFLFVSGQFYVKYYFQARTVKKNPKIRAKIAKIGFATPRRRHFLKEKLI